MKPAGVKNSILDDQGLAAAGGGREPGFAMVLFDEGCQIALCHRSVGDDRRDSRNNPDFQRGFVRVIRMGEQDGQHVARFRDLFRNDVVFGIGTYVPGPAFEGFRIGVENFGNLFAGSTRRR